MEILYPQAYRRWVFAALVVLFLGAQTLQSVHVHADHGFTPECAQCQADSGHAAAVSYGAYEAFPIADPGVIAGAGLALVVTYYRVSARGPPPLSS